MGQGACAKVQGCISLQDGNEFAVKVRSQVLVSTRKALEKVELEKMYSFCVQPQKSLALNVMSQFGS